MSTVNMKVENVKIWVNSRAITLGSGWLLNLAKELSQQTLPLSFMMIHDGQFRLNKGHNSKVLHAIWLVIRLGRDILPTNIFTKFDDYTMKTI